MKTRPLPPQTDKAHRADLIVRLRLAERQLRDVQQTITNDQACVTVARQMAAVRKALDGIYVSMTMHYMEQAIRERCAEDPGDPGQLGELMQQVQALVGKLK